MPERRRLDEQRNPHDFFVEGLVLKAAVLLELLAVVGDEHDDRSVVETGLAELLEKAPDVQIGVGDLLVVPVFPAVAEVPIRVTEIFRVGIEVVDPQEKGLFESLQGLDGTVREHLGGGNQVGISHVENGMVEAVESLVQAELRSQQYMADKCAVRVAFRSQDAC